MSSDVFTVLNAVNVNDKTETKNKLTYLSWAWAWAEFKKRYPNATYKVQKFEGGLPYVYDENTGYMVFTEVTCEGVTHEMWLPVMDGANHAMKKEGYTIKTKYAEVQVQPATMFDINKTIMRCLTKNLAMYGLGLYIYAGEDLPEEEQGKQAVKIDAVTMGKIKLELMRTGVTEDKIAETFKVKSINDLTMEQAEQALVKLNKSKSKEE